jgi:hypothetical protein
VVDTWQPWISPLGLVDGEEKFVGGERMDELGLKKVEDRDLVAIHRYFYD